MTGASAPHSFDSQRRLVGLRLGSYVLGPRLGVGGTASVYLARQDEPGGPDRLVGLKVIHDHLTEETDFVRMFIDEASLAKRMSHPNVVRVIDSGQDGESLYLAMEYLHGQPLSRLFERIAEQQQRLPFDLVMWIGARVADGLHHAHQLTDEAGRPLEVIHRDVSPQNVFLTYDGHVKLIDFGIARAEGRLAKTTLGRIKGKFAYMAPEQVLGNELDQRADLFALGATLYELTVGVRLFGGEDQTDTLQKLLFEEIPDPAQRAPDVPEELSAIIRKALAAEPDDRYANAAEISRDLDTLLAARGTTDGTPALASLMTNLFAAEMQQRSKQIQRLLEVSSPDDPPRQSVVRIVDEVRTPDGLEASTVGAIPADPLRRTKRLVVGVAAGLTGIAMVAGAAVWWSQSADSPSNTTTAPTTSSAPVRDVTLRIQVRPPVEAVITVGGKQVEARPPHVRMARSKSPVTVRVQAEGYETTTIQATPDEDQLVVVSLVQEEKAEAAASSSGKAPAVSGSANGSHKPNKVGPSTPRPSSTKKPPPQPSDTGSLVTEYPF